MMVFGYDVFGISRDGAIYELVVVWIRSNKVETIIRREEKSMDIASDGIYDQ